jgi:hypothetical protein
MFENEKQKRTLFHSIINYIGSQKKIPVSFVHTRCRAPIAIGGIGRGLGLYDHLTTSQAELELRGYMYRSFAKFARHLLFPAAGSSQQQVQQKQQHLQDTSLSSSLKTIKKKQLKHHHRSRRPHHHVVFIQRLHSRVVPNLRELEDALRLALPLGTTFVTACMDFMTLREQVEHRRYLLGEQTFFFCI